jgi:PAS domain S-box-containing protein
MSRESRGESQDWQERVTRPAASIFAFGGLALAAAILVQDRGAIGPRGAAVLACLAALAVASVRRIAWRPLAALLVLTLTVIGAVFPSEMGLRFSPMLVAMLAVAVAASLLSQRAAVAVIVLICLSLLATGYGVSRGWFVIETPTQSLSTQWGRAAALFALVSAALTVVVTGVVRSLESSLRATRIALDELVKSEERLGLALRAADDGLWDWHLGEQKLWYSPRWWAMLGYAPDELPNDAALWPRLVHPDDLQRANDLLARAREGREDNYEIEFRLRHKSGHYVPVLSRGYVTRDPSGRAVRVSGMNTDLTERRRAELARDQFERQLQETQKLESLGIMAGGIAHDFNNLLTGVLGNTSLALLEAAPGSELHEYLREIREASLRAAEMCRQLLAYSGKGRFVVAPQDLGRLAEESAQLLRLSISKKATIRFELEAGLPLVDVDATQIRQVIMNLVINASDALGDEAGEITVRTSRRSVALNTPMTGPAATRLAPGEYVALEVADTGAGMTPETQARIFDPFFTTKSTGRGLGLAAVLGIMRGHHGTIGVQSEPGRGTTFRLLFPAVEGKPQPGSADAVPAEQWSGRGRVLVVDDEPSVRKATARILDLLGFEAVQAADGGEAVEIFRRAPASFVLVLLDLAMPILDGVQTAAELRRIRSDLRIVFMSGFNKQDSVIRFSAEGLTNFVQKPFDIEALRDTLREVLG